MFSLAYDFHVPGGNAQADDLRSQQISAIAEMRDRVAAGRDILYCSPSIRALIETDIPLLLEMARSKA
jgi:hypothetical protein